jgi:hypothetical protein
MSLEACVDMMMPKLSLRYRGAQTIKQIGIRCLREFVERPKRGAETVSAPVVGAKGFIDATGTISL